MTFHRCFLPSFGSFGQAVLEEKIFKNRPIRNKNFLWQPCLLMDREKISILYRGPSIDASYLVSVHLAEGFQRRRIKCEVNGCQVDGKSSHCLCELKKTMIYGIENPGEKDYYVPISEEQKSLYWHHCVYKQMMATILAVI